MNGVYMLQCVEIHARERQWHVLLEKKNGWSGLSQNSLPLSYSGRPTLCFQKFLWWERIFKKKGQWCLRKFEKDVTKLLVQRFSPSCEPSVFQEVKREQWSDLRCSCLFYWRTTLVHVCINIPNHLFLWFIERFYHA